MKLSIIIVNYNVKYFLEHCLCSVRKACKNIDAEIFVVDNASIDGSKAYLEGRFSEVKYFWNEANLGFAKANNLALKETKGDCVLFLNPDTIVAEDCFEKCLHFFSTHADCGAIGVHMIDGAGNFLKESKRSFPTPMASFYKMTGLCKIFPESKQFAKYYTGHLDEYKTASVEVLSGAFMMLSRKVLNRVVGFDEDYFMYGEDIDLSYRIKKTGFKNYYFAETDIIHFKGESTQKNTPDYLKHFYGAMKMFVKKHYSEKKATQLLMYSAVSVSRFFSGIKGMFLNAFKSHPISRKASSLIIVAGHQRFNEMIQLIKFSKKPFVISGRITATHSDNELANGNLKNLATVIKKEKINYVLFCQQEMSYFMIIDLFMKYRSQSRFLIHSLNCGSIIGSNKKDEKGIIIAEE